MCTRGLQTHAQNYLKDYKLKSTLVIIDGTRISVSIGIDEAGDARFGGDPKKIYDATYEYFDRLKQCNVIPILIKGSLSSAYRSEEIEFRREKSISAGINYKKNGFKLEGAGFPIFASNAFYDALNDLEICCCSSDFDANEQIMELSRKLKCPVLSTKYDYCLCDGVTFIPWETIEFKTNSTKPHLKCKVFDRDRFASNISPSILPYLSVIFNRAKELRYGIGDEILPEFKDQKMSVKYDKILDWMTRGENICQSKINEILRKKQSHQKKKIESLISSFLNPRTTIIPTIMKNQEIKPYLQNVNFDVRDDFFGKYEVPSDIMDLVKECRLPGIFLDMYIDKEYTCKINPVEDIDEQSIYAPAIRIMQGIYGLLIRNSKEKTTMTIRMRQGTMKNDQIYCKPPLNFPKGELTSDQKFEILYTIMHLSFDENIINFLDGWHIFVLAFKFWQKRCWSKIDKAHIHSVLLTAFMLHAIKKNENDNKSDKNNTIFKYFQNLGDEDYESAVSKVKTFVTEKQEDVKLTDIHHIHMYLSFQTCLYHTVQVFTLLDLPDKIRIYDFISGSFYHSIFLEIKNSGNIENFFDGCESLKSLYGSIFSKLKPV